MRVDQALGGTNREGIAPAVFAMPAGMRMRYDIPDPAIADCVTSYAIYIGEGPEPLVNWFLPAPPMITILLDAGRLSVSIGNRVYPDVHPVSLWGATSRALRAVTRGGIMVGIGLTAIGWGRLTARSADAFRNTISDLVDVIGAAAAAHLINTLDRLNTDAHIAPALDEVLPALFRHDDAQLSAVTALESLILIDGAIGIGDVADRLGISVRDLRRLATRRFGMPAKTLLSRARFVRSYATWLMLGEPSFYSGIDTSYFDASHFLRDAQAYLGTTPRRFAAQPTAYLRASLHARAAVIGAPAHTLHRRG